MEFTGMRTFKSPASKYHLGYLNKYKKTSHATPKERISFFKFQKERRDEEKKVLSSYLIGRLPKDLFKVRLPKNPVFHYQYPSNTERAEKVGDQLKKESLFRELLIESSPEPNTITTETVSFEPEVIDPILSPIKYSPRGFVRNRQTNRLQRRPSLTITEVAYRPLINDPDGAMETRTVRTYRSHSLSKPPGSAKPKPLTREQLAWETLKQGLYDFARHFNPNTTQ